MRHEPHHRTERAHRKRAISHVVVHGENSHLIAATAVAASRTRTTTRRRAAAVQPRQGPSPRPPTPDPASLRRGVVTRIAHRFAPPSSPARAEAAPASRNKGCGVPAPLRRARIQLGTGRGSIEAARPARRGSLKCSSALESPEGHPAPPTCGLGPGAGRRAPSPSVARLGPRSRSHWCTSAR